MGKILTLKPAPFIKRSNTFINKKSISNVFKNKELNKMNKINEKEKEDEDEDEDEDNQIMEKEVNTPFVRKLTNTGRFNFKIIDYEDNYNQFIKNNSSVKISNSSKNISNNSLFFKNVNERNKIGKLNRVKKQEFSRVKIHSINDEYENDNDKGT